MHYFGPWDNWQGALAKYQEQKDDLFAGRKPRASADALTVRDLANRYLTSKKLLLDAGEIVERTWQEYYATCELLVAQFGKAHPVEDLAADDFEALRAELAKRHGPVCLGNQVQRVRSVFKYGFDACLIPSPVRFGPAFKRPSRETMRKLRAGQPLRMFEAHELRAPLEAVGPQLKAMALLGVNCGFGNADIGTLPLAALDLDCGWVSYPRPTAGAERRCPLWPETVEAVKKALAQCPRPKDPADARPAFITHKGGHFFNGDTRNPLSTVMVVALARAGIGRSGLNFYALRHTFETVGGESRDQAAVDLIVGHVREDMASVYRERISDEGLKAVTDCVRAWLWPSQEKQTKPKGTGRSRKSAAR
jgi:integrase